LLYTYLRGEPLLNTYIRLALSLPIIVTSLYLLLKKTEDGHAREVAMWLLGTIMGYWLR